MSKKLTSAVVGAAAFALLLDKKNIHTLTIDGLGDVGILEFSGAEREVYESWLQKYGDKSNNIRAELVQRTACDESGNLLFSEWSIEKIGALPVSVLMPIYDKALIVNGFKKEALKEAEKN